MENELNLSAHEAAQNALGRLFSGGPSRFSKPGWFHVGTNTVACPRCAGQTHGLRRKYTTSAGDTYYFWAIACPICLELFAPDKLPEDARKKLYQSSEHRPSDHWIDLDEELGEQAKINNNNCDRIVMPISEQVIDETYRKLWKAKLEASHAATRLAMRRAELVRARADLVVNGKINGRNDSEREAQARVLLPEEFAAVERAELEDKRAAIDVELCRIEIERIQAIIRFLEIKNINVEHR